MQNNKFLEIGQIKKLHGLHGFVVFEKFSWIKKIILPVNQKIFNKEINEFYEVEKYFMKKNRQIIKFKEFNTCNQVKKLKNSFIFITEEEFSKLTNNFPYLPYLINFEIEFNNEKFGIMSNFFSTISNPIIEITKNKIKYLVPFVNEYIKKINIIDKKIILKNKFKELVPLYE